MQCFLKKIFINFYLIEQIRSYFEFLDVLPPVDILPCETPLLLPGVCIPIKQCPHILFIINNAKRPLTDRIRQHLRNYQCSYDVINILYNSYIFDLLINLFFL